MERAAVVGMWSVTSSAERIRSVVYRREFGVVCGSFLLLGSKFCQIMGEAVCRRPAGLKEQSYDRPSREGFKGLEYLNRMMRVKC